MSWSAVFKWQEQCVYCCRSRTCLMWGVLETPQRTDQSRRTAASRGEQRKTAAASTKPEARSAAGGTGRSWRQSSCWPEAAYFSRMCGLNQWRECVYILPCSKHTDTYTSVEAAMFHTVLLLLAVGNQLLGAFTATYWTAVWNMRSKNQNQNRKPKQPSTLYPVLVWIQTARTATRQVKLKLFHG